MRSVNRSFLAPLLLIVVATMAQAGSQSYTLSGNYTWTAPVGVTSVTAEAWGGGGAGGGATANPSVGGGGAGGQYASKTIAVVSGNSYSVVVGAGGTGGTGNGGAGGGSSFNGMSVVAKGGGGGSAGAAGSQVGTGAAGSTAGGVGTTVYGGGGGSSGSSGFFWWFGVGSGAGGGGAGSTGAGGNASGTTAGSGATNGGGDGGGGGTSQGTGYAGNAAGGGGGGAYAASNADRSGGGGAAGQVVLTWYLPPTATTSAATSVTGTTATLNGTVTSNGSTTSTYFQYGLDATYGTQVAASPSSLSSSATNAAISAALTGLACGATYHFRAYAHSSDGDGYGDDATFTTTSTCPVILGKSSGTSSGTVDSYVTFTVTATNPNPSAALTNVVVTDALPIGAMSYSFAAASLGLVSVSGTAPAQQTLTWSIAYLPPSTSAALTLVVQLTAPGTLTNTVTSPGVAPASAYIVALPGGIVHYRFDEPVGSWNGTTGEVKDDGPQGLNGTRLTVTSPTTTNTVSPNPVVASAVPSLPVVGGGFCNAGKFDGKAVVQTPNNAFFQFKTALSASAWIYPTAYPTSSGGDPNSDLYSILSNDVNYEFHINSAGKLYWWWQFQNSTSCTSSGTQYTMNSATTIPLNQWTHVAITFDSGATNHRQRIYINGTLDKEVLTNPAGTLVTNLCPMYVGGDITTDFNAYSNCQTPACVLLPARDFHGMIDEPKIYQYELTSSEVQADMTLGRLCSGIFDHVQIEYSGTASTCKAKTVIVKACMDAGCTSLYAGTVSVQLTPTGWMPSDTVTIAGGMTQATLSNTAISGSSITLGGINISPAPNNSTVPCFNGSTQTCTVAVDPSACSSIFDGVEPTANPRTDLYTKLAGTTFNVDLLALLGSGSATIDPNYIGTVTYDLVDTSSLPCPNGTALSAPQTVGFAASDLGRKTVSLTCCGAITPTAAATQVQVRMKLGSTYACSYDQFAVRPSWVTLATSPTMAVPPLPAATPTVNAGAPFTLSATATTPGYSGTLEQDATKLTYQDPNASDPSSTVQCPGSTCSGKGALGILLTPPLDSNGKSTLVVNDTTTANNATYSEAGYLYLAPGAYVDAGFTAIDRGNGDCIVDTTNYNNLSTTLSNGKYGCDIGTTVASLGRFIPDHFSTTVAQTMACPTEQTNCPGGGLIYSGQPFSTTTVKALALGESVTQNYMGNFAKDVTLSAVDHVGDIGASAVGALTPFVFAAGNFAAGVAAIAPPTPPATSPSPPSYIFNSAPTAPSDIFVRAVESEVSSRNATTPANSKEGGVRVVSGRLRVSNAYGSEKQPLVIPIQAQYWSGKSWVLNSADGITIFPASAVALTSPSSGTSLVGKTSVASVAMVAGQPGNLALTLAAPTGAATGSVDLAIDLGATGNDQSCWPTHGGTPAGLAWLRGAYGSCTLPADPSAVATFGIYSPEWRRTIHIRTLY